MSYKHEDNTSDCFKSGHETQKDISFERSVEIMNFIFFMNITGVEKNIDSDLSEESYREILENLEKIMKKIQFVLKY